MVLSQDFQMLEDISLKMLFKTNESCKGRRLFVILIDMQIRQFRSG